MYDVVYYYRPNGDCPAREWIENLDNSLVDSVDARLESLKREGMVLLGTKMMEVIRARRAKDRIHGFYELKHTGKKWRLAVYHDMKENKFVLLRGWRKSQQRQEGDIDAARNLLLEYLSTKGA